MPRTLFKIRKYINSIEVLSISSEDNSTAVIGISINALKHTKSIKGGIFLAWISLIPPLVTIIITFKTKKLVPALLTGVILGALISTGSIFNGITSSGEFIIDAVANKDSVYTLGFLIVFGALAELIEMAGGISGFSEKVGKWTKSERGVLGWSWLLSIVTFFDSSFHTIAVGTVLSPLL